jgi:hypothetical protein
MVHRIQDVLVIFGRIMTGLGDVGHVVCVNSACCRDYIGYYVEPDDERENPAKAPEIRRLSRSLDVT